MVTSDGPDTPRLAYNAREAAAALGIGETLVYELLGSGRLASVKLGRRRLIRHEHLVAFLDALEEEQS